MAAPTSRRFKFFSIILAAGIVIAVTIFVGNRSALRIISSFALDGRETPETMWFSSALSKRENFIRMQESLGGVPLSLGNRVEIVVDGPQTYAAMLEAIESARNHINFEVYIIEPGQVADKFARALIAKAREGVQVNLLYDKLGSLRLDGEYVEGLRAAGVKVHTFQNVIDLRIWRFHQRNHRKTLIVDGRIGFTGGINISDNYLHAPQDVATVEQAEETAWHDIHVKVEGPVVEDMQRLFLSTWLNEGAGSAVDTVYFPKQDIRQAEEGDSVAAAYVGSNRLDAESRILDSYIGAIQAATDRIWITQAYFVPHYEFAQSLIDAAARGVDVILLLPNVSDSNLVIAASEAHFTPLLSAGVKIYRYNSSLLHAKTAVIDGLWATIGSSNIDIRSLEHNNEANLVVIDRSVAASLEAQLIKDLQLSQQINLEQWKKRGLWRVAIERYAIRFSYWL